ncbi:MAG: NAD(+)/NADH kinase [Clostridia bacterium]|nr:NAD(+)/NADH kinase [Clostridia bacterium]
MNRILIIPNPKRDPDFFYTKQVISCLEERQLFVSEAYASSIEGLATPLSRESMYENVDLVIALGGDGTLLGAAREAAVYQLPVLGINLGHLGFLAEIEKHEIAESLAKLSADEFTIENRMMLCAELQRATGEIQTLDALNDIVVSRSHSSRLIYLNLYVNGEFVDNYKADGMIVATPTGSTAYSMSAGGPILDPAVKSFVITPICPHKLYAKTVVVPDQVEITMTINNKNPRSAVISSDGQRGIPFSDGDVIKLKRSEHTARLVKIKDSRFYSVLQHKLLGKER